MQEKGSERRTDPGTAPALPTHSKRRNGATKPFLDLIQIRKAVPPSSSCGSVDHFEIWSVSC